MKRRANLFSNILGVNVKDYVLRWVVVMLFALAMPAAVHGQPWQGRVTLTGTVTNAAGEGLLAVVTATYVETKTGKAVRGSNGGEFNVRGIRAGTWELTINAPNYGVEKKVLEVYERSCDRAPAPCNEKVEVVVISFADLLGQASTDSAARRYSAARESYQKVLLGLPPNHPSYVQLQQAVAMTYSAEGKNAEALDAFDSLLAIWDGGTPPPSPDTPTKIRVEAMISAGKAREYSRMHGYSEALGNRLSAEAVRAIVDLAVNTLLDRGQRNRAVRLLGVAIAGSPNSPLPYYYRGQARWDAEVEKEREDEDWSGAKADFTKFVALETSDTPQRRLAQDLLTKLQGVS